MGKQATAEEQPDGKFKITHEDGSEETLTAKQFHDKYDVEGEDVPDTKADNKTDAKDTVVHSGDHPVGSQSSDEDPQTQSKANRPNTTERDDAFADAPDFDKQYVDDVEAELKELEEHLKEVRAQIKSVKSAKPEDRDFGSLRSAMHDLAHGKSLLRTAHVATVRHDGPERLRPAPTPETNINSGPGEELNPEQFNPEQPRKVGK